MQNQLPIPHPDPLGVPGDIGLILFLLYLTFFLHVILMNALLGGAFMAVISEWISRKTNNQQTKDHHIHLAEKLGHILPFSVSLTVSMGIAPLLFVQVIYGQFFYTSSVLMAWIWLSVVFLIVIGYYSLYAYTRGFERWANRRYIFMIISCVMFFLIAFIYVNNLTLMQTPQKWLDIYTQTNGTGYHWNMDEATLMPRYLHFAFSAIAVAGMLVLILGMREKKDNALSSFMKRWGGTWFLIGTVANTVVGFMFYFAIPEALRKAFTEGAGQMLFLSSHVLFIIGTLAIAAVTFLKANNMIGWVGIAAMLVGIAEKVISRDLLRQEYLKQVNWTHAVLQTKPQNDVIALFFISFVAGIGLLLWVYMRYKKEVAAHTQQS